MNMTLREEAVTFGLWRVASLDSRNGCKEEPPEGLISLLSGQTSTVNCHNPQAN